MNARAAARVAAVILLFVLTAPVHLAWKLLLGRSPVPPWFLGAVAWLIGVRIRVTGERVRPHSLLVCNHTSWIDILVAAASTKCAFVSKDELGHPLIHWLADQNQTVYVKRSHRKGAKDQAIAIAKALERDKAVALFPEGTTGPGTHLLPFRSTLLEAANFAAKDVAIRPVAIDYGAEGAAEVGWWEEPGKDNVLRLLGRPGTLPVTVRLLDPLDRSGDRKQLAEAAREEIARTLGFKLSAHSPIAG
ncbi:MAG: lysophospholipid acyltransferase family protein [Pseudomonadota bacterium]